MTTMTRSSSPCPDMRRILPSRDLDWPPFAATGLYVGLLVVFLTRLIRAWQWSSDAVAPMVIADRIGGATVHGGASKVAQPLYIVLDLATRPLPAHHVVWALIPAAF